MDNKLEQCIEFGYTALNHVGEELCGDNVACSVNGDCTTLVLADGLGSGVKANILSMLTSKILCTMASNDIDVHECVETVIQTLPVCKERGVAYSTFSLIHINNAGEGYLFEFDNPRAILYHHGKCCDMERELLHVYDKKVFKTDLHLDEDDILLVMSDGTIHAGIGQILNFGWDRLQIMQHLDENIRPGMSARAVACLLDTACNDLYLDKPGDDTTVAAIKLRRRIDVNIMVGPPVDKEKDDYYVERFLEGDSKKIVCGGTSSIIVARYLGTEVKTSFDFPDRDVPPIGFIKGIDLATEGVLTLRRLLEMSDKYLSITDLTPKVFTKKDGASLLADFLFERATHIRFFVGQSVNAAHQGLPIDTTMKLKLIETLSKNLIKMGKKVEINYN